MNAAEWKIARICWNSKGWSYPTGEAASLEGDDSYVVQYGFGHEEWLLDFTKLIDGWHYSFLQPVSRGFDEKQGKSLNILLHSIYPGKRVYVGKIQGCQVLTHELAEKAVAEYKRRGWFSEMKAQVKKIGGNANGLDQSEARWVFNIRFLPETFTPIPFRLATPDEEVFKCSRYLLMDASPKHIAQWQQKRTSTDAKEVVSLGLKEIPINNIEDMLEKLNQKMKHFSPQRRKTEIELLIRNDAPIIRLLKKIAEYKCQFPHCDAVIRKRDGGLYVEVAHIEPVAEGGKSVSGNLIVLCPNHHKEFDFGERTITEQSEYIIKGELNGKNFEIEVLRRVRRE